MLVACIDFNARKSSLITKFAIIIHAYIVVKHLSDLLLIYNFGIKEILMLFVSKIYFWLKSSKREETVLLHRVILNNLTFSGVRILVKVIIYSLTNTPLMFCFSFKNHTNFIILLCYGSILINLSLEN